MYSKPNSRDCGPVSSHTGLRPEGGQRLYRLCNFQRLYTGDKNLVFTVLPRGHSGWRSFDVKPGKTDVCVVPSSTQDFLHFEVQRLFCPIMTK